MHQPSNFAILILRAIICPMPNLTLAFDRTARRIDADGRLHIERSKCCSKCKISKLFSDFNKREKSADGLQYKCRECSAATKSKWVASNRDRVREYHKEYAAEYRAKNEQALAEKKRKYHLEHASSIIAKASAWQRNNVQKVNLKNSNWRKANPAKCNAKTNRRRASKFKATPAWANEFFIEEAYRLANLRTKMTGVEWHVDHIVPLSSKIVCGLHSEHNLAVIPAAVNVKKSNLYWPDMP